ncbi:hypothetical protein CR513_27416, partial [Mucuna pruriens]
MYVVGVVCRFMETPTSTHMKAAKRILRYLKGTLDFDLFYSSSNEFKLMGFCDSDFAGDVDDRKSTTGFQVIVTLSTCQAEYVVATSCMCQAILLRRLLKEFNMNQEESTKIHIDNKSTQILAKNPVFHERNKHINTRCQERGRASSCEDSRSSLHMFLLSPSTTTFTMEAKFISYFEITSHGVWLKGFNMSLELWTLYVGYWCHTMTTLCGIIMTKNNNSGSRSKHYDIKYLAIEKHFKEKKWLLNMLALS